MHPLKALWKTNSFELRFHGERFIRRIKYENQSYVRVVNNFSVANCEVLESIGSKALQIAIATKIVVFQFCLFAHHAPVLIKVSLLLLYRRFDYKQASRLHYKQSLIGLLSSLQGICLLFVHKCLIRFTSRFNICARCMSESLI